MGWHKCVSDTNLSACGKLCILFEFVINNAPEKSSVLYVQNLHMVTCFCNCSQSIFEILNYVELFKQSWKWKVFKHETYMKASQLESLKWLLVANLEQRNLVRLCHFSSLCPLQSMHVLHHFTIAPLPELLMKKKIPGCMFSHLCITSCISSVGWTFFPIRASLSGSEIC